MLYIIQIKDSKINGTNNKDESVQLYIEERVSIEAITLSKKKKNMQTEEIECGDKVIYEKKTKKSVEVFLL